MVGGDFCSAVLSNMRVGEAESRRAGAVVVEGNLSPVAKQQRIANDFCDWRSCSISI